MENTPAWHNTEAVQLDRHYYNTPFLKEVVQELMWKARLVQEGMDEFSKAEILALQILKGKFMLPIDYESANEG